jgi:2,3-bisphosphoglycerate-independent phosphoglycerate mutase
MSAERRGPVVLVVLDGFGIGDGGAGDVTVLADAPFLERAFRLYPSARVETSGRWVGLPDGLMGNSEVGHMTLGAGRVIEQDIVRIQRAIDASELTRNAAFQELLHSAEQAANRLHLFGLVSDGGVHSCLDHLDGILAQLEARGIAPVLHAFTDGRDTPPQSALRWIAPLEARLRRLGGGIASVSGRYWAMDRDRRWERVARAYRAIVERQGVEVASAVEAVEKAYAREEGDEFILPTVIAGGVAFGDGDAGLFFNFRADRARELTNAFTRVSPEKLGAEIEELRRIAPGCFATWTHYDDDFDLPGIFQDIEVTSSLGELVSRQGLRQLRIAETEKYAHVTYFFNGGREEPFPDEDRILVPSPKDVATYDQKPEMSALEVTDRLLDALAREDYAFVLLNYANPDMVGHTGVIPAAVRAVEVVDACLDRVTGAVLAAGGTLLVTADHGNLEQLLDPETGGPHTAHTTNPVPLIWVVDPADGRGLDDGALADIAPTLCALLGLEPAPEMTGRSLLACVQRSSSS